MKRLEGLLMKRLLAGMLAALLVVASCTFAVANDISFNASLSADPKTAAVNDSVSVYVFLTATNTTVFNAYHLTCTYDPGVLTFTSAAFTGGGTVGYAAASNGTVTVAGYGADHSVTDYIKLNFTVVGAGDTAVTLTEARFDVSANAATRDIASTAISATESSVTIQAGGCRVTLPTGCTGAGYVASGQDYTFSAPAGYQYSFTATIGGASATVLDNGNGTYTVKNVTGALVISLAGDPSPRSYSVAVSGTGASDVTAAATATYGTDFTFTLTSQENYDYTVTVTIAGRPFTPTVSGSTYTISGTDILGNVVITVNRTQQTGTTRILFTGNGAEDLPGDATEYIVSNAESFSFLLDKQSGYDYTIKVEQNGIDITSHLTSTSSGVYTIPAAYLDGSPITVTVTKTARPAVTVSVSEYVKGSSSTVFLIVANPSGTLAATQGLYYGTSPMFWSEKYSGFAWLVSGSGSTAAVKTAAEDAITLGTAAYTGITYSGDVNKTGRTDVNDAQFVYDIYNARCVFAPSDMEKFLRADLNGDKSVTTLDAQAALSAALGLE